MVAQWMKSASFFSMHETEARAPLLRSSAGHSPRSGGSPRTWWVAPMPTTPRGDLPGRLALAAVVPGRVLGEDLAARYCSADGAATRKATTQALRTRPRVARTTHGTGSGRLDRARQSDQSAP